MSPKPRIAVLLAVYNGVRYLAGQIDTILAQEGVLVTIFVSVDKSIDGSEAWLRQKASTEKRIILLTFGQVFGNAARNFFHLIRQIDFKDFAYIAFSDQDDSWYPDKLAKASKVLSQGQYDAYSSNIIAFWPNGRKILINKAQKQKKWDFIFEAAGPGCTYVFSLNLMTAIKSCLVEHWEKAQNLKLHDWFCYAFARAKSYNWYIDPRPSMLYRQHPSNVIGVNKGLKAYWKRFKEVKSGAWFSQISLITKILDLDEENFIQAWAKLRRRDFLYLAIQAKHCRRQLSSQIAFFYFCLVIAAFGLDKSRRQ